MIKPSFLFASFIAGISLLCSTVPFAEMLTPVPLLKPQLEGGRPLMQVLNNRSSSRS